MSFDLIVEYKELAEDLGQRWVQAYAEHGIEAEIAPGFDPANWEGGFLPFRVVSAPRALVGVEIPEPAVSGFELSFDANGASFRFGRGGPTTEFAMMCLGAALLAGLTNGKYVDPQSGSEHEGDAAVEAALGEIKENLKYARDREKVHHSFPGWAELGVDV